MIRPIIQKLNYWRNPEYLKWVKRQPSVISGLPADDPHHAKNSEWYGSITAPDWATIPLTRDEHTDFHNYGWQTWEAAHGSQYEHIARTLGLAMEAIERGELKLK